MKIIHSLFVSACASLCGLCFASDGQGGDKAPAAVSESFPKPEVVVLDGIKSTPDFKYENTELYEKRSRDSAGTRKSEGAQGWGFMHRFKGDYGWAYEHRYDLRKDWGAGDMPQDFLDEVSAIIDQALALKENSQYEDVEIGGALKEEIAGVRFTHMLINLKVDGVVFESHIFLGVFNGRLLKYNFVIFPPVTEAKIHAMLDFIIFRVSELRKADEEAYGKAIDFFLTTDRKFERLEDYNDIESQSEQMRFAFDALDRLVENPQRPSLDYIWKIGIISNYLRDRGHIPLKYAPVLFKALRARSMSLRDDLGFVNALERMTKYNPGYNAFYMDAYKGDEKARVGLIDSWEKWFNENRQKLEAGQISSAPRLESVP